MAVRPEITTEQVLHLPIDERAKALASLGQENHLVPPELLRSRVVGTSEPFNARIQEYEWLSQHRNEYVGEWLALEGDQLVAHSPKAKEVMEEARRKGFADPLFVYVEDSSVPFVNV